MTTKVGKDKKLYAVVTKFIPQGGALLYDYGKHYPRLYVYYKDVAATKIQGLCRRRKLLREEATKKEEEAATKKAEEEAAANQAAEAKKAEEEAAVKEAAAATMVLLASSPSPQKAAESAKSGSQCTTSYATPRPSRTALTRFSISPVSAI